MPLSGCSCWGGVWATALAIFLALPIQYYVPDLARPKDLAAEPLFPRPDPSSTDYFHWISLEHLSRFDLFLTISLLTVAAIIYLCDWIQRKLMERRIIKLKQYLSDSVERLRELDARQEQLETTLGMVLNATSEYNLLLYLLLRRHHKLGTHKAPPSHCFFDQDYNDSTYIRSPTNDFLHIVDNGSRVVSSQTGVTLLYQARVPPGLLYKES